MYWDKYHQYSDACDASYDEAEIWVPNSPYSDRRICTTCGEEVMDDSHSTHVHEWLWIESQNYWTCKTCYKVVTEDPNK